MRGLDVLSRWILVVSLSAVVGTYAQENRPNPDRPRERRGRGERAQRQNRRGGEGQRGGEMKRVFEKLRQEDPEEFARLMELRQQDPPSFRREVQQLLRPEGGAAGRMGGMRNRGPNAGRPEGGRRGPPQDPMEATCNALSRQYHGTEDADEKGRIRTELAEAVGEAFERRQEDAQKRVEEMEARINEIREALEQRMANRDSICELRLEELTRDPKLTWDPGL